MDNIQKLKELLQEHFSKLEQLKGESGSDDDAGTTEDAETMDAGNKNADDLEASSAGLSNIDKLRQLVQGHFSKLEQISDRLSTVYDPGSTVVVVSHVSRSDLNGRSGIVKIFVSGSGCYEVKIDGEQASIALKPGNLQPAPALGQMLGGDRERNVSRSRAPIPKNQTGDLNVTNASHVFDCKLANKLLPPGNLAKDQQEALDRFLTLTINLPVKTRSGPGGNYGSHPDSDNVLDAEIMKKLGTRQPLSDKAFARLCAKVALGKGKGKDVGFNDDTIKALLNPLVVMRDRNGMTVDERYYVLYEDGKPVNIWKKDHPAAVTGLKDNGEPDLRTTKGKERVANAKTFAQETGLTKDGEADERTKPGQHLGVPKAEMPAALTGKKKDGTPDMRTKFGKQITEERARKQADALSAQSTPLKDDSSSGGSGWSSGGGGGGGGPRCLDGSLDMRFAANRDMDKWG